MLSIWKYVCFPHVSAFLAMIVKGVTCLPISENKKILKEKKN